MENKKKNKKIDQIIHITKKKMDIKKIATDKKYPSCLSLKKKKSKIIRLLLLDESALFKLF